MLYWQGWPEIKFWQANDIFDPISEYKVFPITNGQGLWSLGHFPDRLSSSNKLDMKPSGVGPQEESLGGPTITRNN